MSNQNICDGCPQFNRICDGKMSANKKYCFFYHRKCYDPNYRQSDEKEDILRIISGEIEQIVPAFVPKDYSIKISHCFDDRTFLISVKVSMDERWFPVGYLRMRGDIVKKIWVKNMFGIEPMLKTLDGKVLE
ncbi:hypothetical protein GH810_14355 [Acetobacterium paludosum]|uniref:Uncharacterized protein n=1 Tax=Acetobacterium paludosum TaxID=52693 RepID=A0A923HZJ4_9FIRM|nr:hypothetical protein [Acetobacterium paludosum]MBC3889494.1 hypothetical protein [Acetobacterium paludosum]